MHLTIEHSLRKRYPFAALRGQRITRLEEADLGPFQLDAETAERLAEENIGVFVGGCRDRNWMIDKLKTLAETRFPARWLVVVATRSLALTVYRSFELPRGKRPRMHAPRFWDHGNATFTTPEGLTSYRKAMHGSEQFAAVVLLDPGCYVQQAREWFVPGYGVNDRPQRIADFRAELGGTACAPPLILLTARPAKSIGTARMLSAYCLDAWWFVDGRRLRVGQPPAASDRSASLQPHLELSI